jgi:hypothetical protein
LDILERKIRQRFDKDFEDDLNLLFYFLQHWNNKVNHYNQQAVGIPQEAMNDCSRILSNFFLQEYDLYISEECKKKKASYLRYCDDQFIFSNSKQDLEYLMYKASKKLKALGLSLNQKKVHIDTVTRLIEYRSFKAFDKIAEKNDKYDPKKVENFVDDILTILDSKPPNEIKDRGTPLLNRALFCCIDKIDLNKKLRLLFEYTKNDYLLHADSDKFKRIYHLLSNEKEKGEFLNTLDRLSSENFHNFFHYEVLKFYSENKIENKHIQERINYLANE